ncbi:alpha/beta hydrolase [Vibrio fluvialis]|uniref:alpha/beta hydrolase n=1 Tax=Vibrio sp. bablab_jr001 TaxID=2755067 RepID=UPI0018F1AEDC|nr:alpha/beta hydrolase [Vibrio sp. bablab_jr001]EKO3397975.1 alpha/beta hydrolase [Vibrio fluvialis]EKO3471500.1 alpha/beta hydrolase [Vibrio fluvialis]MBY8114819.1 alpha/beta hydrolase [Vibrio fluvialis]MBY8247572.1 alpha/beta hydrolase [Vibrio fluvialis]MBY8281227.1 alpha/beta hydrolase [Vibrio fluvialis]
MTDVSFTSLTQWFPGHTVIPLWPSTQPVPDLAPRFSDRSSDEVVRDREISQITRPEMVVVEPEHPNGIGLLVLPGGSYQRVAFDKEGMDTAIAMSEKGYTVFVMTYRMPGDGHAEGVHAPLADAQRAIRLIRAHAQRWALRHIGIIGFSAGGHAAGTLVVHHHQAVYPLQDSADLLSPRPDFAALMYPVISMDEEIGHDGSRYELMGDDPDTTTRQHYSLHTQVSPDTPPCFLMHASDDNAVKADNSLVFWQALKAHHVPTELHIFARGGHGFGLRGVQHLPAKHWLQLLDSWVQSLYAPASIR